MPIAVLTGPDPMSDRALAFMPSGPGLGVRSDAERILQQELERYCAGEIQGRSFLIAGHRGAGKTTMVAHALAEVLAKSGVNTELLRVLPVFLHGPSLFESEYAPDRRAEDKSTEEQAKRAIVQVILGLHRAVVKEFAGRYRRKVLPMLTAPTERNRADRGELAAQFEIELFEDPPAIRLREFWQHADALDDGVLFDLPRPAGQGSRELVALNGICSAHQRISGDLNEKVEGKDGETQDRESASGFDLKSAEFWKPVAAVASGSAVAGGAAAGSHSLLLAAGLGVGAALLASLTLSGSSKATLKRERQVDKVFIPDLTLRTLDRVLPVQLDRLRAAGLAPVLIIDELDKVPDLSRRIEAIIHSLKKLMAENVFSCFITDRAYLEYLRIYGGAKAYGVTYSYFSHALLVAYQPADIHEYLTQILVAQNPDPIALQGDNLDLEVLRWILRHRSRMHALDLSREIALLRGAGGELQIESGAPRTSYAYRIDVTFQLAIELQALRPHIAGWQLQRPAMGQILLDALYYLSREWMKGEDNIDIPDENDPVFQQYLRDRMNLGEVHARAGLPAGKGQIAPSDLSLSDTRILASAVADMANFLSGSNNLTLIATALKDWPYKRPGWPTTYVPTQTVLNALLLGTESLLTAHAVVDGKSTYRWRYWPSGMLRDLKEPGPREVRQLMDEARQSVKYIEAVEANLWKVFRKNEDPAAPAGSVFVLLTNRYRVMKTSPAWPQVSAAIDNLARLEKGQGNRGTLVLDHLALRGFEQMIHECAEAIRIVITNAAFLAGVGSDDSLAASLRERIDTLSFGLRFFELDPLSIGVAVQTFQDSVEEKFAPLVVCEPIVAGAVFDLQAPELVASAMKAWKAGRDLKSTDRLRWGNVTADAWDEVLLRLTDLARLQQERHADLNEILCAAAGIGPSVLLGLAFQYLPLHAWSNALLETLAPISKRRTALVAPIPAWLGAFCLRELGVAGLDSDSQLLLRELLQGVEGASSGIPNVVGRVIDANALWQGTGTPSTRFSIVVRKARNSVTDGWIKAPTRGLVVVVSTQQFEYVTEQLDAMRGLKVPIPVFWEQPPDSPADEARSRQNVPVADAGRLVHYFLYRDMYSTNKQPNVVHPAGPDDVLIDLPSSI